MSNLHGVPVELPTYGSLGNFAWRQSFVGSIKEYCRQPKPLERNLYYQSIVRILYTHSAKICGWYLCVLRVLHIELHLYVVDYAA